MTEVSDLSGTTLGADDPTSVTVVFEDGERRRVTVTKAEALGMRADGDDVTWRPTVLLATLRRGLFKLAPWALALLVTALVSNQIATWYADRQQELEIESELSTVISRSARAAYNDAFSIVAAGVDGDHDATTYRDRNKVVKAWTEESSAVDPLMFLHYDETPAEDHWQRFQSAIFSLIEMSYVDTPAVRQEQVSVMRAYLDDYPRRPAPPREEQDEAFAVLTCTEPRCNERPEFRDRYRWLGLRLMAQRGAVARDILREDAKNLG